PGRAGTHEAPYLSHSRATFLFSAINGKVSYTSPMKTKAKRVTEKLTVEAECNGVTAAAGREIEARQKATSSCHPQPRVLID
ncbi:MAG TPA: hypothetical protein VFY87_26260, partial [Geminicoccaceae bacterium]|nr:hypothetical protein [Geminicoccaceae bacterium]